MRSTQEENTSDGKSISVVDGCFDHNKYQTKIYLVYFYAKG